MIVGQGHKLTDVSVVAGNFLPTLSYATFLGD